jgi:ATP-dependent DNA helicase HFM1/MER3
MECSPNLKTPTFEQGENMHSPKGEVPANFFDFVDKDSEDSSDKEGNRTKGKACSRFFQQGPKQKPKTTEKSIPSEPNITVYNVDRIVEERETHRSQDRPTASRSEQKQYGSSEDQSDEQKEEAVAPAEPLSSLQKSSNTFHSRNEPSSLGKDRVSGEPTVQHNHEASDQDPEIHFSLYAPPPYRERPPPVLHEFTTWSKPIALRRQIPIASLFSAPVNLMWKAKFENFNPLQAELSNTLCHSDDNVVVSAPTGAGKTAIFEMAIAKFVTVDLQKQRCGPNLPCRISRDRKMLYLAPSKSLCEERYEDWSRRFSDMNLGIEVAIITGDAETGSCFHDLAAAHFILSTPEKWDSITRRWSENFFLVASVKLFMIDEVHLLGDGSRGCCLESVVSRMKSIQRAACSTDVSNDEIHSSRYENIYHTLQSFASGYSSLLISPAIDTQPRRQFRHA